MHPPTHPPTHPCSPHCSVTMKSSSAGFLFRGDVGCGVVRFSRNVIGSMEADSQLIGPCPEKGSVGVVSPARESEGPASIAPGHVEVQPPLPLCACLLAQGRGVDQSLL